MPFGVAKIQCTRPLCIHCVEGLSLRAGVGVVGSFKGAAVCSQTAHLSEITKLTILLSLTKLKLSDRRTSIFVSEVS